MSVLEKKALAFERLAAINDEVLIDEILKHFEALNQKDKIIDLAKHMDSVAKRYDFTLRRLAQ